MAGAGWVWGCDPAGWPGAAGPRPWVTLWTVWLTLASAPPAGDWPGLPPGAPDGACPGGVLAAAASAAGPVLEPPDPPGKMSWVTPRTADAAALAAGALGGRGAGGRGGDLVRGAAGRGSGRGRNAGRGSGRRGGSAGSGCLAGRYRLARRAGLAGRSWAGRGGCGAGGWPAEDGPWLPPLPGAGVLPGPGRRLWAAPATEPTADAALPGRPAVSPLTPAAAAGPGVCAEPGFCAEAGFWPADARPARSTAKTSAAAKPPHAYRQTLKTSNKARERVADPSTANTLPPDPDIHPYPGTCRTGPHLRSCPSKGRLPA